MENKKHLEELEKILNDIEELKGIMNDLGIDEELYEEGSIPITDQEINTLIQEMGLEV